MEKYLDFLKLQYESAQELYRHEDNLCWKKINNMLYVNFGLFVLFGVAPGMMSVLAMFFGGTINLIFFVFLLGGTRHMSKKKRELTAIQEAILKALPAEKNESGEQEPAVKMKFKPWTLSMRMMLVTPLALLLVWLGLYFYG